MVLAALYIILIYSQKYGIFCALVKDATQGSSPDYGKEDFLAGVARPFLGN